MREQFVPVILGVDESAYHIARTLHSRYGVKAIIFGEEKSLTIAYSKILTFIKVEAFMTESVFANTLVKYAKEHEDSKLILIPSDDDYAKLISQYQNTLNEYYTLSTMPYDLVRRLTEKQFFYQLASELYLPIPQSLVLDYEDVIADDFQEHHFPLQFPIVLKGEFVDYLLGDEDRLGNQTIKIKSFNDLRDNVIAIHSRGYNDSFVAQSYVPGRVQDNYKVLLYVDRHHELKLAVQGQILAKNPSQKELGEPLALQADNEIDPELFKKIQSFLQMINYRGFILFEIKKDNKTAEYVVLNVELSAGKMSFLVDINWQPTYSYLIDDLLEKDVNLNRPVRNQRLRVWIDSIVDQMLQKYSAVELDVLGSIPRKLTENSVLDYDFDHSFRRQRALRGWEKQRLQELDKTRKTYLKKLNNV